MNFLTSLAPPGFLVKCFLYNYILIYFIIFYIILPFESQNYRYTTTTIIILYFAISTCCIQYNLNWLTAANSLLEPYLNPMFSVEISTLALLNLSGIASHQDISIACLALK